MDEVTIDGAAAWKPVRPSAGGAIKEENDGKLILAFMQAIQYAKMHALAAVQWE